MISVQREWPPKRGLLAVDVFQPAIFSGSTTHAQLGTNIFNLHTICGGKWGVMTGLRAAEKFVNTPSTNSRAPSPICGSESRHSRSYPPFPPHTFPALPNYGTLVTVVTMVTVNDVHDWLDLFDWFCLWHMRIG